MPVTITVKNKVGLVVPPSVRRQAGIKAGDRLEFKASPGVITIVSKSASAEDDYTQEQRQVIDKELAKGFEDVKRGWVHGPFTAPEAGRLIRAQIRSRAKKTKMTVALTERALAVLPGAQPAVFGSLLKTDQLSDWQRPPSFGPAPKKSDKSLKI